MEITKKLEQVLQTKFLRPSTMYQSRNTIKRFCELTSVQFTENLTPESIVAYAQAELLAGRSPHTIKARVVFLRAFLQECQSSGDSPASRSSVPVFRVPRKIIRATPQASIMQLIERSQQLRGNLKNTMIPRRIYWPAFIAASYETALRTSDLRQLRWSPQGTWCLIQTKTKRPVSVSVSEATNDLLKRLQATSPNLFDLGWRRESYRQGLSRIGQQIGIKICPQQLRQTAASDAERLQPGTAWILLGHSSPDTTLKWYIDRSVYQDLPRPRINWDK